MGHVDNLLEGRHNLYDHNMGKSELVVMLPLQNCTKNSKDGWLVCDLDGRSSLNEGWPFFACMRFLLLNKFENPFCIYY